MEMLCKKIKIVRTKNGTPCIWESYTEFENLKRTIVIIDENAEVKDAVFINKNKNKQGLVPIKEGDYIVKAFKDIMGESISILRIDKIANDSNSIDTTLIYRDSNDNKVGILDEKFINIIKLTKEKLEDLNMILTKLIQKEY